MLLRLIRSASLLAQPAPILRMRLIGARSQIESPPKVPLRLDLISHRPVHNSQVDLQVGIVGRLGQSPGEVVECRGVKPFAHLGEAIDHQASAIVRRLGDIVAPQKLFAAQCFIAPMDAAAIAAQDDDGNGDEGALQRGPEFYGVTAQRAATPPRRLQVSDRRTKKTSGDRSRLPRADRAKWEAGLRRTRVGRRRFDTGSSAELLGG
jgi:hypothetical protein